LAGFVKVRDIVRTPRRGSVLGLGPGVMGRLGLGFGLGLGSEIRISASFQKIPRLVGGLCLGPRVVGWSGSGVWVSASLKKKQ